VVADLSFISLTTVIPALVRVADPSAEFLLMVKPQFEVGRERLPSGGVVRDPAARAGAVEAVVAAARAEGLGLKAVTRSPLPGPSGNVEFFIYVTHDTSGVLAPEEASAAIGRETESGTAP
jgi:23S rRNA (cytidine1920-2'-O)/16S rRNA (cytidine1409-2'-O)-methyltransferase